MLFGFMTSGERDLFRLLVDHVSGIGPKSALAVLSGSSVASFKANVVAGDVSSLSKVKGIGKKTAERIVVELKDKVGSTAALDSSGAARGATPAEQAVHDAVLALVALGYKQPEAFETIRTVQAALGPQATVEQLVRTGLKKGSG